MSSLDFVVLSLIMIVVLFLIMIYLFYKGRHPWSLEVVPQVHPLHFPKPVSVRAALTVATETERAGPPEARW